MRPRLSAFIGVLVLLFVCSCSVNAWDAEATEGQHKTTWNHGLEISFTGWGLYIGPGRGSETVVENEFTAAVEGEGDEDGEPLDEG